MLVTTTASPRLAGYFPKRVEMYIQVYGAANVRVAESKQTRSTWLCSMASALEFTAADGVRRLPWRGELWIGGAGGVIDLEIL